MKCPECGGKGQTRDLTFESWDPCKLCDATGEANPWKIFSNIGENGTLVFHFPNKEAALAFKKYLCDCDGDERFLKYSYENLENPVSRFEYHTGDNTILVR